jgi:hypothetical protein
MTAHGRIACARQDEDEDAAIGAEWPHNFFENTS